MTRFDYYGSLVRNLKVFRDLTHLSVQGNGWERLEAQKATRPDGFLPYLLSLDLADTARGQCARDWCGLLSLLICPRLEYAKLHSAISGRTVSVENDPQYFNHLMPTMPSRCPKLRFLHLLLVDRDNSCYGFNGWSCFQDLCHLVTNLDVINDSDALLAVAQLPNLTHLALREQRVDRQIYTDAITLPDNLFPALTTLDVDCTRPRFVEAIWSIMPLARHLTQARVKLNYTSNDRTPGLTDSVVRTVCTQSPNLQHLELGISIHSFYSRLHCPITYSSLSALKIPPLKKIAFVATQTSSRVSMAELASSFSAVEDFQILSQRVKYMDVYQIATHLPYLRKLSIKLKNSHILPIAKSSAPISYVPVIVTANLPLELAGSKTGKFLKQTAA
ncbi:hypothetical protein FRC12_022179 [Ceratobasidium sp. 428]|nr:hypothetical protein FRC12_022179 [Ceratobasidium sp. 428]